MTVGLYVVGLAFALPVSIVDAKLGEVTGNSNSVEKRTDISPTLVPESDKKFFAKDYPFDKRPAVDVLHFKHPYPVVQDSGDFDTDYVKDENSDNGEYHAQSEYDRLRHKLAQEKEHVGKALAAKERAEKELEEALKHDKEVKESKRQADEAKRVAAETKRKVAEHAEGGAETETGETTEKDPGGLSSSGDKDVQAATDDTEKAMTELEKCKKELHEAREKLKKLMEELEEARKKEKGAEADLDAADERARLADSASGAAEKKATEEYKEYMAAKDEYLKQQALVAKMANDIETAAARVRAFRDKEDADGGVYPTPQRSSAQAPAALAYSAALIFYFASFLF